MAKKNLFDSNEEEVVLGKEEKSLITIAQTYKDSLTRPYGVVVVFVLSLILGGTLTAIFIIRNALKSPGFIAFLVIIWIILFGVMIYSFIYYLRFFKVPEKAITYDNKTKELAIYNLKEKGYTVFKKDEYHVFYQSKEIYPKKSLIGPKPKKPVVGKLQVKNKDTSITIEVADVFQAKETLDNLDK